MVCALLNVHVPEHGNGLSPVLCVLVFALSLTEKPGTEAFLSVDDVLVNHVFAMKSYMKDYWKEDLQNAFIFPPGKELPLKRAYSKGNASLYT